MQSQDHSRSILRGSDRHCISDGSPLRIREEILERVPQRLEFLFRLFALRVVLWAVRVVLHRASPVRPLDFLRRRRRIRGEPKDFESFPASCGFRPERRPEAARFPSPTSPICFPKIPIRFRFFLFLFRCFLSRPPLFLLIPRLKKRNDSPYSH